jgi:hypothetical protein
VSSVMRAEERSLRYPRYDSTGRARPTHEKPTRISTGVPGLDELVNGGHFVGTSRRAIKSANKGRSGPHEPEVAP